MSRGASISSLIGDLAGDSWWHDVTTRRDLPASEASWAALPEDLHPDLVKKLVDRGIEKLFSHQREVWEEVRKGRDVVISTPTASGKSLAYHLPVLDGMMKDPGATALYLFPTKALARDQEDDLRSLWPGRRGEVAVYDGDTSPSARRKIRSEARLVITNPDMLHTALLPHHPSWMRFFGGIKHVVLDEVHQYRGVFGSHAANVMRRMNRICRFARSRPLFISSSATIANPSELAAALTGRETVDVATSGAPTGPKSIVFYNPPLVDRDRGIRAGNWWEAVRLVIPFLSEGHRAIVFARSRREMEILLTYLRETLPKEGLSGEMVRGYRGGYLSSERREVEEDLRGGKIRCVVATTALELGIDIGDLDVCVMSGYPGSVASTYQQAGRAGRGVGESAAFLIAENSPLDQFIVSHPSYFFGQPPEKAAIHRDNPHILSSHLACASFELPISEEEEFGKGDISSLLAEHEREERLHRSGSSWHWVGQTYPAAEVSLRSAGAEPYVIHDTSSGEGVGVVDAASVRLLAHPEAVYMHGGQAYIVKSQDHESKAVVVEPAAVDYFTEPAVKMEVIPHPAQYSDGRDGLDLCYQETEIVTRVSGYRRLRLFTHEHLGDYELDLPEERMTTTSCALSLPPDYLGPDGSLILHGAGYLLSRVAPLYVLCDPRDIRSHPQFQRGDGVGSVLYFYDNYPGGVGFALAIFERFGSLVEAGRSIASACPCRKGCPSCFGAATASAGDAKSLTITFLERLSASYGPDSGPESGSGS